MSSYSRKPSEMATTLIFKLILSVYITEQYVSAQAVEPLILYGDTVKIEDYPYYAGLYNCGAVILSNTWVMTAAHCVQHVNPQEQKYVWVGGETYANSIKVPYNYYYIHYGFPDPTGLLINDIALLKLSSPLQFSKKIQPIKLPTGPTSKPNFIFVGRGIDETGNISKTLKKVDLIKLSTRECVNLLPPNFHSFIPSDMKKLETTNICVQKKGGMPSLCRGDSGSPLISGDTVVGLASFNGDLECEKAKLSFCVNVYSYVPWIKAITGL